MPQIQASVSDAVEVLNRAGVDLGAVVASQPREEQRTAWATSGLGSVTGLGGGSSSLEIELPGRFIRLCEALESLMNRGVGGEGRSVRVDAVELLMRRAKGAGLVGQGPVSAGGSTRMLRARDGFIALNLAREDDRSLLPAWLGQPVRDTSEVSLWVDVEDAVSGLSVVALVEQASLLGLAVAPVGHRDRAEWQRRDVVAGGVPFLVSAGGSTRRAAVPRVLDLSAMWAGPLCGRLLAKSGALIDRVESPRRPDGIRLGDREFYDWLNAGKQLHAFDPTSADGRQRLLDMIERADVVIEASRPRVMEAWGIDPHDWATKGKVWVSITAYGRTGPWSNRVGFGDDVAVAAGMWINRDGELPWFIGDALADPVTGVTAALAALSMWHADRAGVVDVAMREAVEFLEPQDGHHVA